MDAYNKLINTLKIDTPKRIDDKQQFIKMLTIKLPFADLSANELEYTLDNYLKYSAYGVFSALAFDKSISLQYKAKVVDHIQKYYNLYDIAYQEKMYLNNENAIIQAFYLENNHPKIVIIYNTNNPTSAVIRPYIDEDDLNKLLAQEVIQECFNQFKNNNMDNHILIQNIVQQNTSNYEAFACILKNLDYDISSIQSDLNSSFNIQIQFDKYLLLPNHDHALENAVVLYLKNEGLFEQYQKTRLNSSSILTEEAQHKLMSIIQAYID